MPEHSPEPWMVSEYGRFLGGDPWTIASLRRPHPLIAGLEEEANARRIVACVNALEGVPTSLLTNGAVKQLIDNILGAPVTVESDSPLAPILEAWLNYQKSNPSIPPPNEKENP